MSQDEPHFVLEVLRVKYEETVNPPRADGAVETIRFNSTLKRQKWWQGFHTWRHRLWRRGDVEMAQLAARVSLSAGDDGKTLKLTHGELAEVKTPDEKRKKAMKPTKIKAYPEYMIKIAENCGQSVQLKFPDKKDAEAMRFSLYGLRRAIEKEGAEDAFPDFMRATLTIKDRVLTVGPPEEANETESTVAYAALSALPVQNSTWITPAQRKPEPAPDDQWAVRKPEPASDPYALYMPPEYHNTEAIDREFESRIDAWLASAPIQDTQHTGDEAEK